MQNSYLIISYLILKFQNYISTGLLLKKEDIYRNSRTFVAGLRIQKTIPPGSRKNEEGESIQKRCVVSNKKLCF
jgi:hypothetical protein